jgi:predicted nuclease of predicted toxin-antitoxin system
MKFLVEMGLAMSTAAFLRALGHDAVHLRDQGLQRLSDVMIIEKAVRESRIILRAYPNIRHEAALKRVFQVIRIGSSP